MKRLCFALTLALVLAIVVPAAVPATQSSLPTPESVIGWAPCADNTLATYEQIAEYFHALDAASDRMQLVDIGKTAEGRTQLMAIISSDANMRNLARYQDISQALARAQVGATEARGLAREGKAVVWIDFGLHSTEVAHGQTAPWMAYKAVSEETGEMRFIRDNVIFLLLPNMNPDGTTIVAEWYMKHVGTEFENSRPPELYQKYVGHDNNRDWFMFNQPESRNVGRQLYAEWFPQIVYNQHQTGPFPSRIFIPPFAEPMNPNIPPLVMRGINAVGAAMGRRFDQEGKSGVVSGIGFDTWWNGGMRTAPVLSQYDRHSDRSVARLGRTGGLRPADVSAPVRKRRIDERAVDVLSEPVSRRRVAHSGHLRVHADRFDGRPSTSAPSGGRSGSTASIRWAATPSRPERMRPT